jgi:hypothetical protein
MEGRYRDARHAKQVTLVAVISFAEDLLTPVRRTISGLQAAIEICQSSEADMFRA